MYKHFPRVPKSFELFCFPDTEVYSFDLGANFLTFACIKNVNFKRNVTFKSFNSGCLGGYESVHATRFIDTMFRLSNEDMADMHMAYGVANGNTKCAARL